MFFCHLPVAADPALALQSAICYASAMNVNQKLQRDFGKVASALGENVSDEEMEALLADRHDEIEALLDEAHRAKARGDVEPLEPLHAFLRRARERLQKP